MTYVLPKDLSHEFNISLQTVYNYLSKHEGDIRIKKEFWKTFINLEDFTNFLQPALKPFEKREDTRPTVENINQVENLKSWFSKLENEYSLAIQRTEDLEKYNLNLQEQLGRYGIMLSEEKADKKDILNKYESVQKEFHEKVEALFREKSLYEKRYFLLLGFIILLLIFITWYIILPMAK